VVQNVPGIDNIRKEERERGNEGEKEEGREGGKEGRRKEGRDSLPLKWKIFYLGSFVMSQSR
jgi:hypothetical protein